MAHFFKPDDPFNHLSELTVENGGATVPLGVWTGPINTECRILDPATAEIVGLPVKTSPETWRFEIRGKADGTTTFRVILKPDNVNYGDLLLKVATDPDTVKIRRAAKEAIDGMGVLEGAPVSSNGSSGAKFTKLTGLTQEGLTAQWDAQASKPPAQRAYVTSCNSFVGTYGGALAAKLGIRPKVALGGFFTDDQLRKAKREKAWITNDGVARPRFGDVYIINKPNPGHSFNTLHTGISLEFVGGNEDWKTLEGGQGGPGSGYDVVARKSRKFSVENPKGWIDIVTFCKFDLPPAP